MAGVAGLPETSNINGCDSARAISDPANTAGNPVECRTFDLENTRRNLIALRVKHGADTPIGHRCSNIVEGLESSAPPALIAKQMAELARLLA